MFKFKGEVFSSDGTYAVMREDGTDIANVSRVQHFGADDVEQGLENHGGFRSTDEEYQAVIDRIHAAISKDDVIESALIQAAIDWITDDRDPSTRDILSLEGLKVADWVDTAEERRRIIREIVMGYGTLNDMRAFLAEHGLEEREQS